MPADLKNPAIPQPSDPTIPVWRYMDLSKFAALLQQRALVFPRADRLGDPFEGSVPRMNRRSLETIISEQEALPDSDPRKTESPEAFRYSREVVPDLRRAMVKTAYVSCWHMNEAESAAMWKLYSKSDEAICIRTDYNTLAAALPDTVMLGAVQYVDYASFHMPEGNALTPLIYKRRSFAHEREARALLWVSELMGLTVDPSFDTPAVQTVQVELSQLIKGVYVSPQCHSWFRDVVVGLADTYGLNVQVEQSELNADPLF